MRSGGGDKVVEYICQCRDDHSEPAHAVLPLAAAPESMIKKSDHRPTPGGATVEQVLQ
jgi:hypothetical protein